MFIVEFRLVFILLPLVVSLRVLSGVQKSKRRREMEKSRDFSISPGCSLAFIVDRNLPTFGLLYKNKELMFFVCDTRECKDSVGEAITTSVNMTLILNGSQQAIIFPINN